MQWRRAGSGQLISVDMPYPKMGNGGFRGPIVRSRSGSAGNWTLIRQPDRPGLEEKLSRRSVAGIDLCHYDSDKSWWGRAYAFPILWEALVSDGVFISDDIQDKYVLCPSLRGRRPYPSRSLRLVENLLVSFERGPNLLWRRTLFLTRNGLLEPLGQSQVFAYLRGLSRDYEISLVTYEKDEDWSDCHKKSRSF